MTRLAVSSALLAALLLAGCKTDPAVNKGEVIGRGSLPVNEFNASLDGGMVSGTVSFTGQPPARVRIDMSMDPACAMAASDNMSEPYIINDGKVANVFVYIKSGIPQSNAAPDAKPVVLDQKGCRYLPHIIAVQQGGSVEFRNSDPTMHNIHTPPPPDGNPGIDVSQGPGAKPQVVKFSQPETMLSVRCNNHPWMNAFINVAPTPYFTVTGSNGRYEIGGLPPGNYVLAAVHEKLGEQDFQISIPPKGKTQQNFSYPGK